MTLSLARGVALAALSVGLSATPSVVVVKQSDAIFPMEGVCRPQVETEATGVFDGVGVVTEISATSGALTLDHEDIKGLMPAMVMMYRVTSRNVAEGLKVGDKVAFDIDAKSYTILRVTVLKHAQ
jgi:Cu/Ag efflux protein CusF